MARFGGWGEDKKKSGKHMNEHYVAGIALMKFTHHRACSTHLVKPLAPILSLPSNLPKPPSISQDEMMAVGKVIVGQSVLYSVHKVGTLT